ncbi:dimethylarginine dimethylaminohydrolase family protein [Swaminathania salitolerans]|uniref:arginine deiminase n=1 Tax=Swaminathania salitolerans TaxID=182838 RepID=A0A511BQ83_9PROT|nr:arginine deiminase family protein [Swaminathania salitolerans]GBQ11456.1 amidinotransferase [Swaminathania salitolerans LMG 21291]GEL02489.1 nitrate reductase [Swaminathania salitolerans]
MASDRWFIDSETGTLSDVLLCPPDHYSWNPSNDIAIRTLASGARPDPALIRSQFDGLVAILEREGVTCHFLTPHAGLPYQVYTRDSSQTTPWGPVITRLMRPERQPERATVEAFYGEEAIVHRCDEGYVEGGDIHIIRPGLLAIGVSGGRTTLEGAQAFARPFEAAGWTCRMIHFPEHFLHLDVIFTMVTEGLAIGVTDVLEDDDLAWFAAQGIRILPVSYKEAMRDMGCNVLALGGNRVVSPRHSRRINALLRDEGLSVFEPELDQFSRGGGSIHCMTMPLRRETPV